MADNLVLTPGGFRDKALVHNIAPNHGVALLATGEFADHDFASNALTRVQTPPALTAQFAAHGPSGASASAGAPAGAPVPALPAGWQTYAWWDSGSQAITYFKTDWTVPPAPAASSGQTVFLFNGIQNTGANFGILQPVLQWGISAAGGGTYWAVASWYVTSSGHAFHSNLVRVNTGAKLVGIMTQTGVSGANHNYESTFQGIAHTTLPVANIAPLHWANETLEAYSMANCADFPNIADTPMSSIEIRIGAAHPKLHWMVVDAIKNCGQHTVVGSNVNPGGDVTIHYK